MKKVKASTFLTIFCVAFLAIMCIGIFSTTRIHDHTWIMTSAQQENEPHLIVAHGKNYDFSDDKSLYESSKPIDLSLEAEDGKLLLTDKTNGNTYEGTYVSQSKKTLRYGGFEHSSYYNIVIDGTQGTAICYTNKVLYVHIGDYKLIFEVE